MYTPTWKAILIFGFIFSINPVFGQKSYDKALAKADEKYEYGDYEKALKKLKVFETKISNLGASNKYTPIFHLRLARYYWAYGLVTGFEENIGKAIAHSKNVFGEESDEHTEIMLEAADIYMLYGNYVHARQYIDTLESRLPEYSNSDILKAETDLALAHVLSEQGYYQEALSHISEVKEFFGSRTNKREVYTDKKGRQKKRRVDDTDLAKRYHEYALLLSIEAKTLGKMGEIDKAYESYETTRDWLASQKKYFGKKSTAYVQHQFHFANFKIENGLDSEKLGKGEHKDEDLRELIKLIRKGHHKGHYLAFDIYETQLKSYLQNRKSSRYRNLRIEYENAIDRNFERNSLHFLNLETLEFNSRLDRDKTDNLEDKALTLLANSQTLPQNHHLRLEILDFLFRVSVKARNFIRAEQYIKNKIIIQENLYGKDAPITHLSRLELANFYIDFTDKLAVANDIYQTSFEGVIKDQVTEYHPDYLVILTHIAKMYEYQDRYAEAEVILDQASKIALEKYKNPTNIEYAKILQEVAALEVELGDYEDGEKKINQVLEIYDDQKVRNDPYNVVYLVKAEQTKAKLDGIEGYFDEAEELITDSQERLEDARTLEGYNSFEAIDELASLYISLGNYSQSEELLAQLIQEYEKIYGRNSGKIVKTLNNKIRLETLLGNYTEAQNFLNRSINISSKIFGDNSTKMADALLASSQLFNSIGDYEKAKENSKKAVEIMEKTFGRKHIKTAMALSVYGVSAFYSSENPSVVIPILEEARDIIGSTLNEKNPRYAEVLTNLAKVNVEGGNIEIALASLKKAEGIWLELAGRRGSRSNANVGRVNLLIGDLYYEQKNYPEAEASYIKARDILKRSLDSKHPEYVKTLSKLSRVYYMEGKGVIAKDLMEDAIARYEEYIQRYFKSLSEREKSRFFNTIKPDFEFYNTLAIEYLREDENAIAKMYNNALLTKALILNSTIKVRQRILSSGDSLLILDYKNWIEKKEQLTKALALGTDNEEDEKLNFNKLTEEVEMLEKKLSEKSEAFSSELKERKVEWSDVRSALKPGEIALEMIRFRQFDHNFTDSITYAAIYVQNSVEESKPKLIRLQNGYDMENKYYNGYKNAIRFKLKDTNSFKIFWEPILNDIGNSATVYLSPDGVYNLINLEAIPIDEKRYVLDNSNIALVSNTRDVYLQRLNVNEEDNLSSTRPAMMFGNPDYFASNKKSTAVPSLPGTEAEVRELRNVISKNGIYSDYFINDEATEQQIKKLESPKILHIATHGFFNQEAEKKSNLTLNDNETAKNPLLQTGLLMAGGGDLLEQTTFNYNIENGILTAYEAMNLNLDNTELVVLSACETALGKLEMGEGVYGLQRAFLVAGAETLIMSMFKVDDEATKKLMVSFYKKWMDTGDKRQAFIDAKKEIRNEYIDPIYWGAFVMIGMN